MGFDAPVADSAAPTAPYRPAPPLDRRARARALLDEVADRPVAAALLVLALLAAVGAAAWWWSSSGGAPPPVEEVLPYAGQADASGAGAAPGAASGGAAATGTSEPAAPEPAAGELVVHAAGAVARPGVYHLAPGARVADLVEAAGGLTADGDGDRVNLALPLADGERVYVPAVGQTEVPVVPGGAGAGGSAGGDDSGDAATTPVDLNTASQVELEALPGVGPVTARAIIDHREQHGPFASVDDLLDVRGIGEARLADLRDLVVV